MDIALWELWHTGLLQIAFYPGNILCYIAWAAVLTGGLIQWLLLKRAKSTGGKLIFEAILLLGLLAGEAGYQTIIGWDQLVPLLGYWLCLMLLLGSGIAWLYYRCLKKRAS